MNFKKIQHIYFIGIGGIGMSSLVRYFALNGKNIAGYDKTPSTITEELTSLGIDIHFEDAIHRIPASFLNKKETLVVYTPAIPENHTEYNYFVGEGFTVLKRAEILGEITKKTYCLAVAGTHGKTTTSAILGHIMHAENATSFLGGIAENYRSNLIAGGDKISVNQIKDSIAKDMVRKILRLGKQDSADPIVNLQNISKFFGMGRSKGSQKIMSVDDIDQAISEAIINNDRD